MYSYGFGGITNHFPDMAYHPESEKLVHVRGTCGLGMLRREPLGVLLGKRRLLSFRKSVRHKSKHEKNKTGWESMAF